MGMIKLEVSSLKLEANLLPGLYLQLEAYFGKTLKPYPDIYSAPPVTGDWKPETGDWPPLHYFCIFFTTTPAAV
jgi:hypothetical protein